jgi:hypothetical protein
MRIIYRSLWNLFFLCLVIYFLISIRKISATITDSNKKIANATLLFKEASNLNSIKEFNMSRNGIFSFVKERVSKLIEVKSNGYLLKALQ